jgi:hypothetical protein
MDRTLRDFFILADEDGEAMEFFYMFRERGYDADHFVVRSKKIAPEIIFASFR